MKKWISVAMGVSVVAVSAVWAQEVAVNPEDLQKQRAELQGKVRELDRKLGEIRGAVAKDAELAPQLKAVADARAAVDAKAKANATVAAAAKAAEEAARKTREVSEAEGAAAPEAVAADKEVAAKRAEMDELEAQQRLARFLLSEAERKVSGDAEVRQAGTAARAAQEGVKAAHNANAQLVVAAKTVADARAALQAKVKVLPETLALAEAEKAYQELLQQDAGVTAAKVKAEEARQAQAEVLRQKTLSTTAGGEQQRKLEELAAKLKAADEAYRLAQKKGSDARREAAAKSPKVAEAQKEAGPANEALRKATVEATQAERAAFAEAEKALKAALDQKVAASAAAAVVAKEKAELQARIKALDEQLRPARKRDAAPADAPATP